MNATFSQRLSEAFGRRRLPDGIRLMVVRRDGLMVWDAAPDQRSQSLAALCGGVWEASMAMAQTAGAAQEASGFRLVFDDAATGMMVLPLSVEGQTYYLAGVYGDCVNPARLRRQVQELRDVVAETWVAVPVKKSTPVSTGREGYLFTDITDEEMDRLFGVGAQHVVR
jgi:hypothetical protein